MEIMNARLEEVDGKYVAALVGEMDTAAATEAEEVLACGSKVTLRGVNDEIKNVFKLTGFISIFEFE